MAHRAASDDLDNAPSPADPRKPDSQTARQPDSPTHVDTRSWKYVVRKTVREFAADRCTDIAASLTYYAVLALFPALIALISLLGVVGQGKQSVSALLGILSSIAPATAVDVLRGPLEGFATSGAAGIALVSGIVLAIWSASGYVGALSRAMNRVYEIEEGRPFWKLKPLQLLVTLVGIVLILVLAVILIVSGPVTDAVGSALRVGQTAQVVWSILKWPVLAGVLVLMIDILDYATPNVKQPKFRWTSLGSLLALVALVIASVGSASLSPTCRAMQRTTARSPG